MPTIEEQIGQMDQQALNEINEYIDELKKEARGDYDFVVKYLKNQFQSALGTDDTARAEFFSKVANQLESRIGQIPYDYELKTGREKEDLANFLKQKDMEDSDQRAKELQFKAQQEFESGNEQEAIRLQSNARGLLGSGIEQQKAQETAEKRRLFVTEPQQQQFAQAQAVRDEERRLGGITSGRAVEDITTTARRAGQEEQTAFNKGSEAAQMSLQQRLAAITRTGQAEKRSTLAGLQSEELFKRSLGNV